MAQHQQALIESLTEELADFYRHEHAEFVSTLRRKKHRKSKPSVEPCAALARAFVDAVHDDTIVAARMTASPRVGGLGYRYQGDWDVVIDALTDKAYVSATFCTSFAGEKIYAERTVLNAPVQRTVFDRSARSDNPDAPRRSSVHVTIDRLGKPDYINFVEYPDSQRSGRPAHVPVTALSVPLLTLDILANGVKALEGTEAADV